MARSGHIKQVRAAFGSGLLLMPAVCAAVIDQDQLLLLRHREDGRWGTPGGAVEPGESPEEAVRRELAEETGLDLYPDALIAVTGGPGHVVHYPNGDQTAYITAVFALAFDDTQVIRPDGVEVDAARWVGASDLDGLETDELTRNHLVTIFTWLSSASPAAIIPPPPQDQVAQPARHQVIQPARRQV